VIPVDCEQRAARQLVFGGVKTAISHLHQNTKHEQRLKSTNHDGLAGIGVVDNPESALRPGNGDIETFKLRRQGGKCSDVLKADAVTDLMDKGCVL